MKPNIEHIKADAETGAIYKITDDANTPPEVKKFLLDYLFEKTGIRVEFSEVETEQDETQTTAHRQNEQIERDKEIKFTPARACELVEWIITQGTGIYSADAKDDRQKQALLLLLSAMAYDDDATNRENILIDVTKRVFGYSFDCDNAENLFIKKGFASFRSGEWNAEHQA